MIKFLMLFSILLLSSCGIDISESLFIASIGFEINENEIKGYFYLPLSSDVGKSESEGKGEGEFVKVGGENIEKVFNNVKAVNSIDINLRHVSSVVINNDLYNEVNQCDLGYLNCLSEYTFDCFSNCKLIIQK